MAVCVSKVSAAVVQTVPHELTDWFMEWQHGITAVVETFDGYQGTDVYPASPAQGDQWVTVLHFDDDASLERWLRSPQRTEWVSKLQDHVGGFELKKLNGGFSEWFARVTPDGGEVPGWKMATTVLLGLYPTVMLLSIFVVPYTSKLGMAFSMLVGNAISVAFLQWVGVPLLEIPLRSWFKANAPSQRACSWGGLVAILALLVVIAAGFSLVTG